MPLFKRKFLKYKKRFILVLTAVIIAVVIFIFIGVTKPLYDFASKNNLSPFSFLSLLLEKEPNLKLTNQRANLIILGVSGGNHDGANLTDSNIFLSIDFKGSDIVMVSVPRDIYLPSLKTKLNSVYYYGEKRQLGGGLILAKSSVAEVLGKPVSYAFKLDFTAFKNIIDLIGGIDIDVEEVFEDRLYPIPGKENDLCSGDPQFLCRYETVSFQKGLQHMDGERSLKFVRSRYSNDKEGSDFSRSRRQQQVINVIANKVKGMLSVKNLPLLKRMFDEVYKYLETDMNLKEMISIGKYFFVNQNPTIRQVVLDTGDDVRNIPGLLVNPPLWQYDGVWVLVPRTGDYTEIHQYISCQLEGGNCQIKPEI
ncbi:hypothetical protein A2W14_00930 [Candidatus Gottesmanbacteria bacterium RBG_16_37_8]|uniref:Cell envelope-related transcriptional attenuator domain-containing protein n=1 Tax=Candidatus Gottesmanbacteria bacterium RBG_16_37_8 TaxID=1798371 RepID=A0A1F5YQ71_9BACT|nr:MAG: hypothetical protein A2W14_00930 [Candidatus Gottesmanbacteria bacterium RBG_16_37_8]